MGDGIRKGLENRDKPRASSAERSNSWGVQLGVLATQTPEYRVRAAMTGENRIELEGFSRCSQGAPPLHGADRGVDGCRGRS